MGFQYSQRSKSCATCRNRTPLPVFHPFGCHGQAGKVLPCRILLIVVAASCAEADGPCDISRQSPQLAICRPLSLERPVPWAEAVVSREGPVSDVMLGGFGGEQAAREARFDSCQRAACQAREMLHAKEYGDAGHREFQFSGFELFRACFSQEIDALGASGLAGLFGRSRRSCGAVTIEGQRRSTSDDVQRR